MGEWPQINWLRRATMFDEGDAILGAPRRNVLGTTSLTPPVLTDGGPIMTDTLEAEAPEPVDIKSHLAALKRERELQLRLTQPMTVGEFLGAWLREARLREIENEVICELLREIRAERVAGLPETSRP